MHTTHYYCSIAFMTKTVFRAHTTFLGQCDESEILIREQKMKVGSDRTKKKWLATMHTVIIHIVALFSVYSGVLRVVQCIRSTGYKTVPNFLNFFIEIITNSEKYNSWRRCPLLHQFLCSLKCSHPMTHALRYRHIRFCCIWGRLDV